MTPARHGLGVIKPGILTLVQDLGRFGYQHLGLTTGGAADEQAHLWANRLLGNSAQSATLEICYGGLQLEAQVPTRIAITGADLQPTLNGQAIHTWQTHNLVAGDRLHFGHPKTGVRAYLAVQGGFTIEPSFGSVATVMREGIGGLDGKGRPLKSGDCVPCSATKPGPLMRVAPRYIPDYSQPLTIRVIEGHQSHQFHPEDRQRFYSASYRLSNHSDRMGARLEGPALKPRINGIVSEGINFGAIQVPPDGQAIILLKDRQTIGGYPKLGTAFARDLFLLAQRQPGALLRFTPGSLEEEQKALRRFYAFFGFTFD
ncbi:biotin-dependent carboxyltransferase family protein [Marinimicrobium sp. ABcell2]|uniref:5-oxoprolinase subunit C family protein n=1 Tax=Marinimicrobium sp. ABcell2 TaxID=3069751 RepID=UPI0027B4B861|nr:biotin-dependent carboxyltransferase family protein [Marinimicrobium sp. ABcell2]MDQ2076012.1 biotin-dependent carboxyltransferase family protein [Marinimicrobium sp. ABcell2]